MSLQILSTQLLISPSNELLNLTILTRKSPEMDKSTQKKPKRLRLSLAGTILTIEQQLKLALYFPNDLRSHHC